MRSSRPQRKSALSLPRDSGLTRAAILAAAEKEFAQHGLAAARTENIAALSGLTKGMIYHHFESKEALYEAVLEQVFAPILVSLQQFAAPDVPPRLALEQIIQRILELTSRNPGVPAMLFFETIQNHGAFYEKIGFPSVYHVLTEILERGKRQGVFRPIDSWHTAVNIIGACCFYYCAAPRLDNIFPARVKALRPAAAKQHGREALDMILNGILRQPD